MESKSVYIHIPFCQNICSYCDFCKFFYNEKWVDDYLEALNNEIKDNYCHEKIKTIYVGGGTPTVLNCQQLEKLLIVISKINLSYDYEYTFETNIESLNEEKIELLSHFGVNRVSIGVQSFDNGNLKLLNRTTDYQQLCNLMSILKKNKINNINLDLMYAIPGEDIDTLKKDINLLLGLNPTHISTYSLIIEPHTKLYIDGCEYIDEDIDYQMYQLINKELKKNNYIHYEISNFAKQGYESKHNLVYWNNLEYYGFGIGASGYINGYRYTNTRSFKDYVSGKYLSNKYLVSAKEQLENFFILGFRKIKGVNKKEFQKIFGYDIYQVDKIQSLIKDNKLIDDGDNIFIAPEYIYVSNEILLNFLN